MENPGGGEYVYSLWIKSQNLQAGSNFSVTDASGANKNYDWMRIFNAPHTQDNWDVFSCRVSVPAGSKSVGGAPVCNGPDTAFIDNASLTLYEGTDHNACAPQAVGSIKIDGSLTDFNRANPVPLMGTSQLRTKDTDSILCVISHTVNSIRTFAYDRRRRIAFAQQHNIWNYEREI